MKDTFVHKKKFGQNFLADKNILREIAAHAKISEADTVLEIGAGQGVLSREILERGATLHAIEIDETLREWLSPLEHEWGEKFRLHFADAVKIDYSAFSPFPNKVVANIPYNITTPLLHKLIGFAERGLRKFILTVQLEAAQRLMAKADTKARYPLGVTLEAMGSVKILRHVARTCFRPPPNVDSCVIEINLERNFALGCDENWNKFLHTGFRQRRKKLLNNMKGFYEIDLEKFGIDPNIRAEDLSCEEWGKIYGGQKT